MKVFILFFLTFSVLSSKAQEKTLRVSYINFNDTIVPEDKKYTTTVLIQGNQSVSYKLPFILKGPGMYLVSSTNGNRKYEYYTEKDTIKLYVFKSFKEESMVFQSEYGLGIKSSKTYTDSLHPFQWVLHPEKRKIGQQLCKKATMSFRGRRYTAWFDESIQSNNGPWKFGGLPGLIIEIYDETFMVYWTLSKIEYSADQLPTFPLNINESYADYKKGYKENFLKLKRAIESSNDVSDPECKSCLGNRKNITDNSVEDLLSDN